MNQLNQYPFVSIVVPVLNGEETIQPCLESLQNQDYPKDRYEIIVVDNGSTDSTADILKDFQDGGLVFLKEHEKRGSYAARNVGIRNAKGSIIAFTDADCVADKEWLVQAARHFKDDDVIGVSGQIKAFQPKTIIERYQEQKGELTQDHLSSSPFGRFPLTANAVYRKEAFNDIGLFDDSLSSGDVEFAKRVEKKTKKKIVHEACSLVYHRHRTSLTGLWEQRKRYGYGAGDLENSDVLFVFPLRIYSPALYAVAGLLYYARESLRILFCNIFYKKRKGFLSFLWLDFYGEIAFRVGYQEAQGLYKEYHFFNFPKKISLEEYEKEKNFVIRKWKRSSSVDSVYLCGSLAKSLSCLNPGISDIDLVPVLQNGKINDIKELCSVRRKSKRYREFFLSQESMFISKESFPDLQHLTFLPQMEYVYQVGSLADIQKVDLQEEQTRSLETVFGILLRNLLKFQELIDQKDINVSEGLNLISSQRHNIVGLKTLGFPSREYEYFAEKVSDLRKKWFFLNKKRQKRCLVSLLKQNMDIQKLTVCDLSSFIKKRSIKGKKSPDLKQLVLKFPRNILIIFSDNIFYENKSPIIEIGNFQVFSFFPRCIRKIFRLAHWKVLVFPEKIAYIFLIHASFSNIFSERIKNCFHCFLELDEKFLEEFIVNSFEKQSKRYNRYWEFLSLNNLSVGFCAFINLFLEEEKERVFVLLGFKKFIRGLLEGFNRKRTERKLEDVYGVSVPKAR